uniref:CSON009304 protein n=1 Tax=Culicoides sonorensis TaxID=179676 RepID=A0A336M5D5_CULSO
MERCDRATILCYLIYTEGCYCKDGYLRDPKTGQCIPGSYCAYPGERMKCKRNEQWRLGNECSDYCKDGSYRKCYSTRYGCRCKKGLKRHPKTRGCVLEKYCPPLNNTCTGPYEVFKSDGNPCMDKCNKDVVRCQEQHEAGCYCIDGYARDLDTNICRLFPCENCGENAEWVYCAGSCDNLCDFELGRSNCTIQHIRCPDGCRCKEGFARQTDENSPCISINHFILPLPSPLFTVANSRTNFQGNCVTESVREKNRQIIGILINFRVRLLTVINVIFERILCLFMKTAACFTALVLHHRDKSKSAKNSSNQSDLLL